MEGTSRPASGSVLTLLVRDGGREGNRAILTLREGGAKCGVTARTRHRDKNKISDNSPGGSLDTDGPGNNNRNL